MQERYGAVNHYDLLETVQITISQASKAAAYVNDSAGRRQEEVPAQEPVRADPGIVSAGQSRTVGIRPLRIESRAPSQDRT